MISFMAFGDFGWDTPVRRRMFSMIEKNQDGLAAVLSLGDNFYSRGVSSTKDIKWSEWERDYRKTRCPFYAVLGNHDYMGDPQSQIDYGKENRTLWDMPSRYYDKKFFFPGQDDGAHIFFLDTFTLCPIISRSYSVAMGMPGSTYDDIYNKEDTAQWTWLIDCLRKSTMTWKVVVGHYPVFSNGMHGNTQELTKRLQPILRKFDVDFYLSGHDHDMEYIPYDGTQYMVSGTGCSSNEVAPDKQTVFSSTPDQYGVACLRFLPNHAHFGFLTNKGKHEWIITKDKHVSYKW